MYIVSANWYKYSKWYNLCLYISMLWKLFQLSKKFETCLYLIEAWNCGYKNTKISLRILSAFYIILWLQQLFMDCSDFFATALSVVNNQHHNCLWVVERNRKIVLKFFWLHVFSLKCEKHEKIIWKYWLKCIQTVWCFVCC